MLETLRDADLEKACPICKHDFTEEDTAVCTLNCDCKYAYHLDCIQKALAIKHSCPTCRGSVHTLTSIVDGQVINKDINLSAAVAEQPDANKKGDNLPQPKVRSKSGAPLAQSFIEIVNQVEALEKQVLEALNSNGLDSNNLLLPSFDGTKVSNLSALCGCLHDSVKKVYVLHEALNTYRKANDPSDDRMIRAVDYACSIKMTFNLLYSNLCVALDVQATKQFKEVLDTSKQLLLACESSVGDRVKDYDKIVAEVKEKQVLLNTHIDAFKLYDFYDSLDGVKEHFSAFKKHTTDFNNIISKLIKDAQTNHEVTQQAIESVKNAFSLEDASYKLLDAASKRYLRSEEITM